MPAREISVEVEVQIKSLENEVRVLRFSELFLFSLWVRNMLSFPYKLALNFVVKALSSHDYGQMMDQKCLKQHSNSL
jgi:hypothetical protein